jgi:hypothetical protein
MRYAIGAATLVLMPWLSACGQSGSPTSPQTLSGTPAGLTSDPDAVDTADALGQTGTLTFKGALDGQLTSSTPISGTPVLARITDATGHAARFGKLIVTITHLRNTATAGEDGTYVFTTAKGDTLRASFTGTGTFIVNGVITITDTATVIDGTGRFAGATGSFQVTRVYTDATGQFTASFTGVITLQ